MSSRQWRVLVADDDPIVALLSRAALPGEEFAVTVVDDGNDALDAVQREDFDIALLDVEMPSCDGLSVCAAIRNGKQPDMPVLLITGHSDPVFLEKARALSAPCLQKPVEWQVLPQLLRALLATV
jgi:CheY-like chemotaxis protein